MLPLQNFDSHKWIIPNSYWMEYKTNAEGTVKHEKWQISSFKWVSPSLTMINARDANASKTWELHICTLSSLYYILCCNNLNFNKVHFPFLDNILIFLRVWINYKDFAADESKESKETLVSSDSFQFHLIL